MLNATFLHYMAAHEDAGVASQRLHQALVRLSGRPASSEKVADLVVTCFGRFEFELAHLWRGAKHTSDWVAVSFTAAAGNVYNRVEMNNFATSEEAGIAFAAYELSEAGNHNFECRRSGDGWVFVAGDQSLCHLHKPRYEHVAPDNAGRVRKALDGLHEYGDLSRLEHRLRDLPGLGTLRLLDKGSDRNQSGTGPSILSTPGSMSKCLRKNTKDMLGLELTQGASQEALAAMFGFRDWNEMLALSNRSTAPVRPVTVYAYDEAGTSIWALHYADMLQGVWGFCDKVRQAEGSVITELHAYSGTSNCLYLGAVKEERSSCLEPVDEVFVLRGWTLVDEPDDDAALSFAQAAMKEGSVQHA